MKAQTVNRRSFLKKSITGAAGLGLGYASLSNMGCQKSKSSLRPNILLVVADDAGWNDVGNHGSEIKTPSIDQLTKTGVELNNFYVYPTCSPTRASLLTGRYPSRYGIHGPIAMKSKQTLPEDTVTLPKFLSQNGYTTAITGKWHLGLRPESGPNTFGFEYSYGYLHGQIDPYTHYYKNGDMSWHRNGEFFHEEGHATDLITNEAIRYMKELRDPAKPFFLYVPYSVPHYPLDEEDQWVKPYSFIENESRRKFAASMAHMDNGIGQLINTLETEGLRENTLVIFISDNGAQEKWNPTFEYDMKFAANDQLGDNTPLRDWKGSLYEGGIRVPACFNWPKRLKPQKTDQVLHVADIMPVIASMIGAPVAPGLNLDGDYQWKDIVDSCPLKERTLYWQAKSQFAIRRGDWKLVFTGETIDQGTTELFNIATDPHEKKDVASENPEILSELMQLLKDEVAKDSLG